MFAAKLLKESYISGHLFFPLPIYTLRKKIMVYNRGEEIFRCQPYAFIILFSLRKYLCDFCLKYSEDPNDLKKCSSCKMVYYCSKNCQGNAWLSYHSQECKIHMKVQEHHTLDQIMVPNIYLFYCKSPPRHYQFLDLEGGALMEYFLKGSALSSKIT